MTMRGSYQGDAASPPGAPGAPRAGLRVVGPLLGYYSDLASGYLFPEKARIENLQFRVRIDPAGAITYQTPPVQIVSNYNFVIRRIVGFAMNPGSLGNAPALIDFNLVEQGRSFSVFKRNVSFASMIGTSGAGNICEWDGAYICVPGTSFDVTWAVDTGRWGSLVGSSREVGIQIIGDLVSAAGGEGG
jgi:hypothetical protein